MTSEPLHPSVWPPRPGIVLSRVDRAEAAQARGRRAAARADQLAARRQELASGAGPPTPADIARARRAVRSAVELSTLALARAAEAHSRSAQLHLRTANVLESYGLTDRAREHRQAAAQSDLEGREAKQRLERPPYSLASHRIEPAPVEIVDAPPCPSCGSTFTVRVHHTLSLCPDCGHICRVVAVVEPCEMHIWITSAPEVDLGAGVPVEEHCAVCGEVRLVGPEEPIPEEPSSEEP